MKKFLKKVWYDPVGASVMASLVILVITSIWASIKTLFGGDNFIGVMKSLAFYQIDLWIFALLIFSLLVIRGLVKKYGSFKYDSHSYENDKKTYNSITSQLSKDGIIHFLRTNNFAGFSFRLSKLDELDLFYEKYSDDASFVFFNPKLEKTRVKLMNDIDIFRGLIAFNTFPTSCPDLQTVPPEWEETCYDHFWDVVNKIHESTKNICQDYDLIVQYGIRDIKLS